MLDDGRIWLPLLRSPGSYIADARTGALVNVLPSEGPITNAVQVDGVLYMGGWTPGLFRARTDRPQEVVRLPIEEEVTAILPWGGATPARGHQGRWIDTTG
jgi:hypothetical protein